MTKITREELLKIAKISNLALQEDEIAHFQEQIQQVLSYAARVKEIARDVDEGSLKSSNIFRKDQVLPADADAIMARAPEEEQHLFVVPMILEK